MTKTVIFLLCIVSLLSGYGFKAYWDYKRLGKLETICKKYEKAIKGYENMDTRIAKIKILIAELKVAHSEERIELSAQIIILLQKNESLQAKLKKCESAPEGKGESHDKKRIRCAL